MDTRDWHQADDYETGTEDSAFNDLCSTVVGLAKHFDEGHKSLLVRDDFKDDSACICIRVSTPLFN